MFQIEVVEKIKTHIIYSITFYECHAMFELVNVEKYDRAILATNGNIIRPMRFACWMATATNTILTAFPRQHWLPERASVLRFTYIACLIIVDH
jgi:hypothetical protein